MMMTYGRSGLGSSDRRSMGAVARMGALGGLSYVPDLEPVGSGAAGTYYPRDTRTDADALVYLGFMGADIAADHVGTYGSQKADMSASQGAWDPSFRAAVAAFQKVAGMTADGWIGPQTRKALSGAVAAKNAQGGGGGGGALPAPPSPNVKPVSTSDGPSAGTIFGVVAAGAAAIGLGWWLLK